MTFIEPALASRFDARRMSKGSWCVEEKLDGHRLLFQTPLGVAWSRLGNERKLPPHLMEAIRRLPPGVYDSEMIRRSPDKIHMSHDVTRIERPEEYRLVIFDMLMDGERDLTAAGGDYSLVQRLHRLAERVGKQAPFYSPSIDDGHVSINPILGERITVEQLAEIAGAVWSRGGEGLMVKEMTSSYRPGKRMLQWLKIKRQATGVGTLVGFEPGLMGPHSVAIVKDTEGRLVPMKAKDHQWLERMRTDSAQNIGRSVLFEYTERTPSGAYREPRWDRFEDE